MGTCGGRKQHSVVTHTCNLGTREAVVHHEFKACMG